MSHDSARFVTYTLILVLEVVYVNGILWNCWQLHCIWYVTDVTTIEYHCTLVMTVCWCWVLLAFSCLFCLVALFNHLLGLLSKLKCTVVNCWHQHKILCTSWSQLWLLVVKVYCVLYSNLALVLKTAFEMLLETKQTTLQYTGACTFFMWLLSIGWCRL